jgi:hypothetical protein
MMYKPTLLKDPNKVVHYKAWVFFYLNYVKIDKYGTYVG